LIQPRRQGDIRAMRLVKHFSVVLGCMALCQAASAAGKASHVVLIVWDGMRPDFVTQEYSPTLFAAAREGVTFLHHHPVYLSSTEVNGTAFATGVYPGQSTITANDEYRIELNPLDYVETQSKQIVRRGDDMWTNRYLAFPTVAEILHGAGIRTAIAGSKGVALLADRAPRAEGAADVTLFAGQTLPEDWRSRLTNALGPFPAVRGTAIPIDKWTTEALTGPLWSNGVPAFSLLWMAEPDYSQHKDGPGAPNPLKVIKAEDDRIAQVLQALKDKNALDSTDVIIASDHGFSTVKENVDICGALKQAGFNVFKRFDPPGPKKGYILVVSDGGAVLIYVIGHDAALSEQLVHFLQAQPYTGVLFTRSAVAGTFPLSDARIDSPYAADIVVTMRWTTEKSSFGVPGMIYCNSTSGTPNKGSHTTLCPTDMHNTCIAFGPDFAHGLRDNVPSGNIDIAPTILWILGVTPKQPMSGRVLTEAMTTTGTPAVSSVPHRKEASWKGDGLTWHQYLDTSEVNGVTYLDEGNGSQETTSKN
jgi:arylsulfatase A-like enzyme